MSLDKIFQLIEEKYQYELQQADSIRSTYVPHLKGIKEEITEMEEEIKENNSVYLEDELSDILRDFLNIIHRLDKIGYIDSVPGVLERVVVKYGERFSDKVNGIKRDDTKTSQKQQLLKKYENLYGIE